MFSFAVIVFVTINFVCVVIVGSVLWLLLVVVSVVLYLLFFGCLFMTIVSCLLFIVVIDYFKCCFVAIVPKGNVFFYDSNLRVYFIMWFLNSLPIFSSQLFL